MASPLKYQLDIDGKHIGSVTQIWYWYGEMKGTLMALCNHSDYTSDTRVYIDDCNNVVEGYSYLVNQDTNINVIQIDPKDI